MISIEVAHAHDLYDVSDYNSNDYNVNGRHDGDYIHDSDNVMVTAVMMTIATAAVRVMMITLIVVVMGTEIAMAMTVMIKRVMMMVLMVVVTVEI